MQAKDVILGLLKKKDMSGYDIKKRFEEEFSFFFDSSYGSVYPTLKKLESNQYIHKKTLIQEGKPNKHLFSITKKGEELFECYLESEVKRDNIRSDICMRLYFGEFINKKQMLTIIKNTISQNEKTVHQLEHMYTLYGGNMSDTQKISLEIGIEYHKSQLQVLQDGIQKL
ncbi:PadR family transcriptional regulator [Chengkuizengella axinellae]|uniref:PadR family transcriptional regulator n=1 Tax=Chengkuizengella axinellae TaxID=3064388 RepID=A0ABT9J4T2_9BACL|nr:PadR family transcriptional regulator [Chengkuizengella sp. 2205SS18-9]MDP5276605.1 PadR family transcriptional regulator [Chengkuizengella sp. 2205SS18-9]